MPVSSPSRALSALALSGLLAGCMATLPEPATAPMVEASTAKGDEDGLVEPMMEPTIVADPAPRAERPSDPVAAVRGGPAPMVPRAGVITAGDIDDTLNLAAFQRYLARSTGTPKANFAAPVLAQLTGPDGAPAPGVHVTLRKPGAAEPFYDGYSGVDGRIAVFPGALGVARLSQVELRAFPAPDAPDVTRRFATGTPTRIALPVAGGWHPDFLDLVLVVDTTGSMGDELDWLTRDLGRVIATARRSAPGVDIRLGLVVYRDRGDQYVVRTYGFTGNPATMQGWLRAQSADGGGDYPEAAAAALQSGVGLDWRRGKGERILIHIADAPPHDADMRAYLHAAETAAAKGVQIVGLGASGVGPEAEALMRQAAALTDGRYIFLTDDSGVGLSHAEPTVNCYRVTRLTDLVTRVLQSELTGRRIEAPAGAVLREVGSYAGGVCRT